MSRVGLEPTFTPERQRRRKGLWSALIALVVVIAVIGGATYGFLWLLDRIRDSKTTAQDFEGPGTGRVVIQIAPGDTATAIGKHLKNAGVVASVEAFVDAAEADEASEALQAGYYRLPQELPARDALSALLDPASRAEIRITVPEGLRLDETLKTVASKSGIPLAGFQTALKNPAAIGLPAYAKGNPEGFLFPATYDVPPGATAVDVLKMMTARFDQAAKTVGLDGAAGMTPQQIVTIASLVESEARLPEDFGPVARVVYNRLQAGMPLQFDSTVNYALKADKELVLIKDLGVNSPYNTYKHAGLPPGPISSPGEAAMQVAVEPPPGDWLYFVTVNPKTGETKFTASYEEFLQFRDELKKNQG